MSRFTPEQVAHVDQAHASALQAAVVGLALLRSAERAVDLEPLPTWQIEEWAQKHLEAMGSAPSPKRAQRGNEDTDGRTSTTDENPLDGADD